MPTALTDMSTSVLSAAHDAATTGLVVSVTLAALFALAATATSGERDRRQSVALAEAADVAAEARRAATTLSASSESAQREAHEAWREAEAVRRQNSLLERRLARAQREALQAPPADEPAGGEVIEVVSVAGAEAPPVEAPPVAERRTAALGSEQATLIAQSLRPHAEAFSIEVTSAPSEDARLYAAQIADALRRSGVTVDGPYGILTVLGEAGDGVFVSVEGPGALVLEALQGAGLIAQPVPSRSPEADALLPDQADVRLFVGAAPGA